MARGLNFPPKVRAEASCASEQRAAGEHAEASAGARAGDATSGEDAGDERALAKMAKRFLLKGEMLDSEDSFSTSSSEDTPVASAPPPAPAPPAQPTPPTSSAAFKVGDRVIVTLRNKQYNGASGKVDRVLSRQCLVLLDATKEERKFYHANLKLAGKQQSRLSKASAAFLVMEPFT